MKLRLLALVVCLLAVAPAAIAQQLPTVTLLGFDKPNQVTNRVYTTAVLKDGAGNVIGKVHTGSATLASGRSVAGVRVSASGLEANKSYTLVFDGHIVGSASTNSRGILKMKFASPSKGRVPALPEAVLPIAFVRTATLFDSASQAAVATGNFASVK
jgi:hypothetical protein